MQCTPVRMQQTCRLELCLSRQVTHVLKQTRSLFFNVAAVVATAASHHLVRVPCSLLPMCQLHAAEHVFPAECLSICISNCTKTILGWVVSSQWLLLLGTVLPGTMDFTGQSFAHMTGQYTSACNLLHCMQRAN